MCADRFLRFLVFIFLFFFIMPAKQRKTVSKRKRGGNEGDVEERGAEEAVRGIGDSGKQL